MSPAPTAGGSILTSLEFSLEDLQRACRTVKAPELADTPAAHKVAAWVRDCKFMVAILRSPGHKSLVYKSQQLRAAFELLERTVTQMISHYQRQLSDGGFSPPELGTRLEADVAKLATLARALSEARPALLFGNVPKRGQHNSGTLPRADNLVETDRALAEAFSESGHVGVSDGMRNAVLGTIFHVSPDAIRKRLAAAVRGPKRGTK